MGIVRSLFNASKPTPAHPRDPVIASWFDYANVHSGVSVTPESAMRVMAVYRCVRLIAQSIASLPLILYRGLDAGKEPAPKHPLYSLLHDSPNDWQTAYEFREMMQAFVELRGNAYAEIIPTGSNPVGALIPLHPDRITPFRAPNRSIAYAYAPESGETRVILQHEMFHLRGLSWDGIIGLDPITLAAEAIGVAIAAERFGGAFFGNNTVIGGVLEHPGSLSDKAYARIKESWSERHQGPAKAHKPQILEENMKWHTVGLEPEKAQFLETRKFQVTEIARMFDVPPHKVMDLDKATFSNIEHLGIEFVVDCLRPRLVRWEQAIKRDLLTESGRRGFFAEHKVDGLLRGDIKSRYEAYQIGAGGNAPWLTRNEIRGLENYNQLPGLDKPLVPLNMSDGSKPEGKSPDDKADGVPPDGPGRARALLLMAIGRVARKEAVALRKAVKKYDQDSEAFNGWLDDFFSGHAEYVAESLQIDIAAARDFVERARTRLVETEDRETETRNWEDYRTMELISLYETCDAQVQDALRDKTPPIIVNVAPPAVNVDARTTVNVPEREVHLEARLPEQKPADIHVDVAAPQINLRAYPTQSVEHIERDDKNEISVVTRTNKD